jgi:subtilase family serine protease
VLTLVAAVFALTAHLPEPVASGTAPLVAAAPPSQPLELTISLPARNEDELRALIRAIYDPAGPEFRHYLSEPEFAARYSPTPAEYGSLVRWAVANGLQPHALAANRHVLDVSTTVAAAERALHVRIGIYRDPARARTFFAPDREPAFDLAVPVLHVSGLDSYFLPVSHLVRADASEVAKARPTGSGPGGNFIASDVRAAYYGGSALTGTAQSLGLFEYAGYNLADVDAYFAKVGQAQTVPIVGVSVNGANLNCGGKCDDSEQVLDMEEALSMAPGLKQLVVYVGKNDPSIINQMASDDTSKQLSCSWGWNPDAQTLDPIFEEMAAQGQSFLVATGDDGYHLKDGVVWPADDPWVTAVGGTDLTTDGPGGAWLGETGWAYSGGGPSPDRQLIPDYQKPFVTTENAASATLRNVPDIAGDAQVDNYSCYDGGCYTGNGGTSYAAPLWAGYIALTNEYAAASNEAPVGFLNPALYELGGRGTYRDDFHDEVRGYNGKYSAHPSFDLVTGFGSPHGDTLIRALARGYHPSSS